MPKYIIETIVCSSVSNSSIIVDVGMDMSNVGMHAGYGFYRPHVQMMDPGWLADRTQRGPEDQGTRDGGNDPVGVVKRYFALLFLSGLDAQSIRQAIRMQQLSSVQGPAHQVQSAVKTVFLGNMLKP